MIDGSGMTQPDPSDPSTWTATSNSYPDEWQTTSFLSGATNSKTAWTVFDLGSPTADLEKLYLWNVREVADRGTNAYNLYHAVSPSVPLPPPPPTNTLGGDYDFSSGGWSLLNTSGVLNLPQRGGTPDPPNAVIDLGGVSAQYIGVEILSNHGSTFGNGRVGLAEVAVTQGAGGPEPVIIPVPNGEFAMYKPGTGYAVTATFDGGNSYSRGVGDGLTVIGSPGTVSYSDGTSGRVIDVPGWVGPVGGTNTNDLWSAGFSPDGTTCLNVFGTWSGQNGTLIESAAPLGVPANRAGMTLELSAMVNGTAGPLTFDLLVDGAVLTPDSLVDPSYAGGSEWEEILRTYTDIPAGDVTILVGTAKPGPGDPPLFGTRMRIDNISLTAVTDRIPEPATLSLLGLGALLALRRRRR